MSVKINKATAFEDCGVTLMDRIQGNAGTNITQASLTSIVCKVYECDSEEDADNATGTLVAGGGGTLTIASVVYDSLQTAAPWDSAADATGYNFRYNSPAADRPTGGKWHRFEFMFTPTSGAAFAVVWIVETLAMAGS